MVLVPAWRVDRTFEYVVPPALADSLQVGSLVRATFGHRKVRAIVVALDERAAGDDLLEIASLVVRPPVAPPPMDELLDWLARRYVVPRGRAFDRVAPTRVKVAVPEPDSPAAGPDPKEILGYDHGAALVDAIEAGAGGVFVLRPVAGADRATLIAELVAAATRARANAGAALVCVPEVKYGSSILERLVATWPDAALVDTSRPEPDRARAWLALANGAWVGGGGRATVLAPCPRLRLIVLDEEHHRTYKEDRAPKYDARVVALERARLQGAVCVLVSGAPTVESGAAAAASSWTSVEPARQEARAARPIVELVDVPSDRAISHELHERVRATLREGRRVGLLVPTRGYARALWCASCRRSLRCARCEAGMSFDRSEGRLRCPHCALVATPPSACPSCGATDWRYMGAGSERVAEQIARAFPRATVARVDPDSIDEPGAREAEIYVTTWIGTKEALRPDVGLVGVLNADSLIRRPEFRAAETAYQALAEMAEWAGPASDGGRLVIQTSEPGHHAVQAVVRADYGFFLDRELPLRQELGYPPFSELIKAVAVGPNADELVRAVADACGDDARVLGPMAARIDGRRDPNARELLAKCRDALVVSERLRDILAAVPGGNRLTIDVDPR